ncbi:hypothetical protein [Lentzea guizhouensis]|uniref:hypothetical protein n=1 Tax=Lentzea guizhouensis TaxID=1586287 RepID=UPI001475302A|nr:hypothetical protein [Lentzea guizhouensis]
METIRTGKADVVIVVAADESPEPGDGTRVDPYDRNSGEASASASVALVVESAAHAPPGARPRTRGAGQPHGAREWTTSVPWCSAHRPLPVEGVDLVVGAATAVRRRGGGGRGVDAVPSARLTATRA